MSLVIYSASLLFGILMVGFSGAWRKRAFWIGSLILTLFWCGTWGPIAVADRWWFYGPNFISLGHLVFPVVDLFYFIGGVGWFAYLAKRLDLI